MGLGRDAVRRGRRRVFRLVVEYDGSGFFGWQVQPGARTVQGELEDALARVLGEPVRVSGAGRTDRGVHALGQVASFQTAAHRSEDEIRGALDAWLPPDVVVKEVAAAGADFHARHSAVSRRYRYRMCLERTALDRDRCWFLPYPVRVGRMRGGAARFLGEHDFRAFTVAAGEVENTRAIVKDVRLRRRGDSLTFEIEANRFLRKMVRAIVGTLVGVARGRFGVGIINEALSTGECDRGLPVAPARGLYLVSVTYEPESEHRT